VVALTTYLADYFRSIAENERVTLVNEEGRSFLKRESAKFDLIWFVAPDSTP
jgi:spermidine synthase